MWLTHYFSGFLNQKKDLVAPENFLQLQELQIECNLQAKVSQIVVSCIANAVKRFKF